MKLPVLILIYSALLLLTSSVGAQAPNYLWAKTSGASNSDFVKDVTIDNNGNSYVVGYFVNAITFGSTTLISVDYYDIYVVKYDPNGNVVWATSAGGSIDDMGIGIAVDGGGNVYITGNFNSPSLTFGSTTLNNPDIYNEMFVAKYDANGNVVWAVSGTGPQAAYGSSIGVDANNNCFVTGSFIGTTITFGTITLTNVGNPTFFRDEVFVVKYDAVGSVVWAKSAAGSSFDKGTGIAVDANGNSYITGWFGGPGVNFGGTYLSTTSGYDIFLVKYDSVGNVVWAKNAGGSSIDYGYGIAIDPLGNSFVTGTFLSPTITFGSSTLTNVGMDDTFVMKFDPSGNPLWAKSAGGTSNDKGKSIATDASGNCYVTGYYASTAITFGSTTFTHSVGLYQLFLVKYNANGTLAWAKSSGGVNDDVDVDIAVASDSVGHCFMVGSYRSNNIIFGSTTLVRTSPTSYNMFITKLDNVPAGSIPTAAFSSNINNIAIGGSVNFTDLSTNNPSSWNWIFAGGSPANSTAQNPSNIIYNSAGCYAVSLIATNSTGSDTITQTCYINVGNNPTACGEMFFSEYIEGSSNNKALEIYNPTSSAINLSNYAIGLYNNGSTTVSSTFNLSGTIASNDVFVVANSASVAIILAQADVTNNICQFNGNDAVALIKNGNVIDVIGQIGINPGTAWTVGAGSTLDYTLVRNANVDGPSFNWSIVQNQWTVNAINTATNLGQHSSACNSTSSVQNISQSLNSFSVYPNPSLGVFTITLSEPDADILICDMLGQQILSTQATHKDIDVQLSRNGVYLIYVTTKHGTSTQKLVIYR